MVSYTLENTECVKTKIGGIDELVGCIPPGAIVDFYGEQKLVRNISYKLSAWWHCNGKVALGIIQREAIAYNLYTVKMFLRAFGCSEKDFLVSRAFRIEDAVELIKESVKTRAKNLILINPYNHSPETPREYWKLTPLNGNIRKIAASGIRVALFNTTTKFGAFLPEGGKMHHHQTHIIIRLDKNNEKTYKATLLKHYNKKQKTITAPLKELFTVNQYWEEQYPLLKWY